MADLIDIAGMFAAVADAGIDPSVLDSNVRMPKARSILDWAQSEQFLNLTLFARQAEQSVRLFSDFCPQCTDIRYLDNVPVNDSMAEFLRRVVVLEDGVCPRCHHDRKKLFTEWWEAEGVQNYPDYAGTTFMPPNEVCSCQGQRSGKSTMVGSVFSTYRVHQHLCLANPYAYHEVLASTPFQGTFVAVSKDQVLANLWPYFHGPVTTAPWFRLYASEMRKQEKKHGLKKETLFKVRGTLVYFGAKALVVSCGAANEDTLRGATRIFVAIDEIGFMRMGEEYKMAAADQVYTALSNSLRTIRGNAEKRWKSGDFNVPTGLMMNISSPKHKYDKIMSLLRDAKKSPRMLGIHLATWEVNPNISRESLRDEEIRDVKEFRRNFEAIPPLANDPYIADFDTIEKMQKPYAPVFDVGTVVVPVGDEMFVAGAVKNSTPEKTVTRILAVDAGYTKNGFALSLSHIENTKNEYDFVVDGVFTAIPERTPNGHMRVHFPTMADAIISIVKDFKVRYVLYDRWQSVGELQRLQQQGIQAEAYSPVWADFEALKSVILSQRMRSPMWEKRVDELDLDDVNDLRLHPYTHMGYQIATVQDSGGKKVGKPAKGDDDIFRTLVLAYSKFRTDLAGFAVTGYGPGSMGMQKPNAGSYGIMVGGGGSRRNLSVGQGGGRGIAGSVRKLSSR